MSSETSAPPAAFHPRPLESQSEFGFDSSVASSILLKLAAQVPSFTTQTAIQRLGLPRHLLEELSWELKSDRLLEVMEQTGPLAYRYAATQLGREQAARMFEVSGYVGPIPVSLDEYAEAIRQQGTALPTDFSLDDVRQALGGLVLPESAVEVAALAASSRRSLFVFGPPGNGKTTLGRSLHKLFSGGRLWIPHSICVDHNIIRIYDEHIHHRIPVSDDQSQAGDGQAGDGQAGDGQSGEGQSGEGQSGEGLAADAYDQRWIAVERPFVVTGGEMTMDELDLAYSPTLRYYEAPPHVKANGGTFMIDDFGRQRMEPHELLNRWIIPLEHHTDHLSLVTGQKVQIPFDLLLIVATNLRVADVADPAFLRRMGYRLHIDKPNPQQYEQIFAAFAQENQIALQAGIIAHVLERYEAEDRELRGSEPRDLLQRAGDVCRLQGKPPQMDEQVLDIAWRGYFGGLDDRGE